MFERTSSLSNAFLLSSMVMHAHIVEVLKNLSSALYGEATFQIWWRSVQKHVTILSTDTGHRASDKSMWFVQRVNILCRVLVSSYRSGAA